MGITFTVSQEEKKKRERKENPTIGQNLSRWKGINNIYSTKIAR